MPAPGAGPPPASSESIPFVSERDARGETARVFADIRTTLGLPVVNLIWRHFATIDGGLEWAWGTLRPLYVSGAVERAAARAVAGLALERLARVPASVLHGAGVAAADAPVIAAILDSYNRGNALNACALAVLLEPPAAAGAAEPGPEPAPLPVPAVAVPPMPELAELAPPVRELVWQLNTLGQVPGDDVLASLYKHLAPWPGFLALAWALLAPLHADGRLAAAVESAAAAARREAGLLARHAATPPPSPAAKAVRTASAHFVERVIARMIPVAQMLRLALGPGH